VEASRLAALARYRILDSAPEANFDRVVSIVAATFDVPLAMITLVDRDRCWYTAEIGMAMSELTREDNMCDTVIRQEGAFVIPGPTRSGARTAPVSASPARPWLHRA